MCMYIYVYVYKFIYVKQILGAAFNAFWMLKSTRRGENKENTHEKEKDKNRK